MSYSQEDTIAAIATAVGESSIAVVRVSGPEAIGIVDSVFKSGTRLADAQTHTVHYGRIVDTERSAVVDEVLVTLMKGPRSFTAEDVVEVSTHGGMIAVKSTLELLLRRGARIAEPGEFTKRAFLNGRIDLTQAEAVIDLIRSKSDRAFQMARKQSEGSLSKQIVPMRQRLIELLAHVEVNIDYPEHDVEEVTANLVRENSGALLEQVRGLLSRANEGKILREGIVTVIAGRPNAGKSSLLNALARDEKAIVTDIPGTTRDIVEETISLGGIPLRLLDTAGIRDTSDVVEKIGVERSRAALEDAELVLLVLNHYEPLHEDERKLLTALAGRSTIVVINKMDLERKLEMEEIERLYPAEQIVFVSALEGSGLANLEQAVSGLFFSGAVDSGDMTYVSNVRHIDLLQQTVRSLEDAIEATYSSVPIDLIQIDLAAAWESLGGILGDAAGDSLLDQIFSQFCLGK